MHQDSEFLLLQSIHKLGEQQIPVSQRDLARAIQMSLGMTNALIKRLNDKGLVWIHKINPRTVRYVLSPEGMAELVRRTNRYLKRTMKHVVRYKEIILEKVEEAKNRGYTKVALLGKSDIDFVIEWATARCSLDFKRYDSSHLICDDVFIFVAESFNDFLPSQIETKNTEISDSKMPGTNLKLSQKDNKDRILDESKTSSVRIANLLIN